jgi:hypothetical protein
MRHVTLSIGVFLLVLMAASKALPLSDFEAAQVVIGQTDFTSGDCNQGGGSPAANTLCSPSGAAGTGKKLLYLADANNARVLGFKKIPKTNGASANFVLGQTNFSNTNRGDSASALGFPTRVEVAGKKLLVVDFDNSRVLIWNKLPTKNDTPANVVVGQPGFNSGTAATTQSGLDRPEAGLIVAKGKLFVSDRNNNRIMIWNKIPTTNGANADVVLGQTDFTSSGSATSQTGLNEPEGIWSDGKKLAVADFFNSRVLIWNSIPTTNGAPADVVVGQPDFTSFDNSTLDAQSLNEPGDVTSDGTSLFVADSRNNRILVYTPFPTSNNPTATHVLGQADFTHNDSNLGNLAPTAQSLSFPLGISLKGNNLIVDDEGNARFLIFGL